MRVLSVVTKGYYRSGSVVDPLYLFLTRPLLEAAHEVEHFDHVATAQSVGTEKCTVMLVEKIRQGRYDLVLYQTLGKEPVATSELSALSRETCIAAWNSDDNWQWPSTSKIAHHFTYMVTTYRHIYEENKGRFPNLVLSQWGCLSDQGKFNQPKDIAFSFVGSVYGLRNDECRFLRAKAGLQCFGRGSRMVNWGMPYFKGAFKLPWLSGLPLDFSQVNDIWNRSRVSYTPLKGGGDTLQVKSRVFEMGLSGTLMLCENNPEVERYYTPGVEFVAFDSLEDCAEKAHWYLKHESERMRIVTRYKDRTLKEHLWRYRYEDMFRQMDLA